MDCYSIAVVKEDTVIGHIPQEISQLRMLFLRSAENTAGQICCRMHGDLTPMIRMPKLSVQYKS